MTTSVRHPHARAPVTPGHEVAGMIAELGDDVEAWAVGDRVGVGWFGGSCGHCSSCRTGDVVHCPQRRVPGLSYPGGWAETITVPVGALARIPDGPDFVDAARMGCAGVTAFNAVRHADLAPGATVAVFGLGGLGHLAVWFAAAMGHRTTAIARGTERAALPASSARTTTSTAPPEPPAPQWPTSAARTSSSAPRRPPDPSPSCSPACASAAG
jgi:alcohol dehydrogenase